MLLMNGGRERTPAEFAALFVASGFKFVRVVTTRTPLQLLEAVSN